MAEGLGIDREGCIEVECADIAALEPGPGVGVRIGAVDRANEVGGQVVGLLVSIERLERTGKNDPTEIPQHRSEHEVDIR